jgi:hypothetical protein
VPVPKEIELKLEVAPANLPRLAKIPRLRALKTPAKSATERAPGEKPRWDDDYTVPHKIKDRELFS